MIDHRTMDFEARARQITGGPAVELILDAIARDSLKKGYQQRAVFRQRRDLVQPAELSSPTAIGDFRDTDRSDSFTAGLAL